MFDNIQIDATTRTDCPVIDRQKLELTERQTKRNWQRQKDRQKEIGIDRKTNRKRELVKREVTIERT